MSVLAQLVAELQEQGYQVNGKSQSGGLKVKAPSNVHTGVLLDQPGGIFSVAGADNVVVNAYVRPEGYGGTIPVVSGNIDDPRFPVLTGFTAENGARPTYPCDDAPSGFMKGGTLTAQFGRIMHQTNTIETNTILHRQRGAATDLRLLGAVVNQGGVMNPNVPTGSVLDNVVAAEMIGVGVQMERDLTTMLWQGTPDNNTVGGGHKEFPGLDSQIATGQVDAETNTSMPAADSYISDYNYNLIDGTGNDIVGELSFMEYYLRDVARSTGLMPVTWDIVMRPELWYELTSVWPCLYYTNKCMNLSGNNPVVINDDTNVRARDDMRNNMFIDINGRRYNVIVDDGIFEHTNVNNGNVPPAHYASSIYMVPRLIRGNFPSTYWEHISYTQIQGMLSPFMGSGYSHLEFWTDDGRFLWNIRPNGFCFDMQAKIEPRVVLRTPHLAGKLQNVLYSPLAHLRSPFPESPYNFNGGVSVRSTPAAGYAVWR